MNGRTIGALAMALCFLAGACACSAEPAPVSVQIPVSEDLEFGGVFLGMDTEAFNAAGFELGDSCDAVFSTGYRFEDIPYFDGYYTRSGQTLICAYPGFEFPVISENGGGSVWTDAGLREGDSVTITLREKGKYRDVEQQLSLVYSLDRADYADDEAFANFRPLSGGGIAPNRFFRGASPADNRMNRAETVNRLLEKHGIAQILDLADTEERLAGFRAEEGFSSEFFMDLYRKGKVLLLGLGMDFHGAGFRASLAAGLREMMKSDRPVYIHCLEGKDRTGFVCILLEALAGADLSEIRADYMLTYRNYYGVTEDTDPDKYRSILEVKFYDLLEGLTGLPDGSDYSGTVLRDCARQYLLDSGMTDPEIDELTDYLTREP